MKYQKNMVLTLRAAIILAAVMAIFAASVVVPVIGGDIAGAYPEFAYMLLPCEIFLWISAAVFLAALVLAWKITSNIAVGESFSEKNARLLMYISRLALTECVWYAAGGAAMFVLGLLHPGIAVAGMVVEAVGICAAVACSALSHLTEKAAAIRAENDLTI